MNTTIQKWGNSQGIRLPKYILDQINWNVDEVLNIEVKENAIILRKKSPDYPVIDLEKLFSEYNGETPSGEIDWGEPQGAEIW